MAGISNSLLSLSRSQSPPDLRVKYNAVQDKAFLEKGESFQRSKSMPDISSLKSSSAEVFREGANRSSRSQSLSNLSVGYNASKGEVSLGVGNDLQRSKSMPDISSSQENYIWDDFTDGPEHLLSFQNDSNSWVGNVRKDSIAESDASESSDDIDIENLRERLHLLREDTPDSSNAVDNHRRSSFDQRSQADGANHYGGGPEGSNTTSQTSNVRGNLSSQPQTELSGNGPKQDYQVMVIFDDRKVDRKSLPENTVVLRYDKSNDNVRDIGELSLTDLMSKKGQIGDVKWSVIGEERGEGEDKTFAGLSSDAIRKSLLVLNDNINDALGYNLKLPNDANEINFSTANSVRGNPNAQSNDKRGSNVSQTLSDEQVAENNDILASYIKELPQSNDEIDSNGVRSDNNAHQPSSVHGEAKASFGQGGNDYSPYNMNTNYDSGSSSSLLDYMRYNTEQSNEQMKSWSEHYAQQNKFMNYFLGANMVMTGISSIASMGMMAAMVF